METSDFWQKDSSKTERESLQDGEEDARDMVRWTQMICCGDPWRQQLKDEKVKAKKISFSKCYVFLYHTQKKTNA